MIGLINHQNIGLPPVIHLNFVYKHYKTSQLDVGYKPQKRDYKPAIGEVRDPAIGILLNMERAGREVEVDQGHRPRIRGGPCGPALGGLAQKKVEGSPCIYIYMFKNVYLLFIYLSIYLFMF